MESIAPPVEFTKGATVGAWLAPEVRTVFVRHVGLARGAHGKFASEAIVEKLRREGAFDEKPGDKVADTIKGLDPEEAALVVEFAELVKSQGPLVAKARLEGSAIAAAEAAGSR